MSHSIGTIGARTSSAANPITTTVVIAPGETILVVMFVVAGATNRSGGSLTYGTQTLTQANTVQKAVTSPEVSVEMWYLVDPIVGSETLTIPNAGALTIRYTAVAAKAPAGGGSYFVADNGANATSTNPTVSITVPTYGNIWFAVVGSGATTWAPSAQNGTIITNTDAGANGDGFQYGLKEEPGAQAMGYTFGTSDDWGIVAAVFGERPAHKINNLMSIQAAGLEAPGARFAG